MLHFLFFCWPLFLENRRGLNFTKLDLPLFVKKEKNTVFSTLFLQSQRKHEALWKGLTINKSKSFKMKDVLAGILSSEIRFQIRNYCLRGATYFLAFVLLYNKENGHFSSLHFYDENNVAAEDCLMMLVMVF